MNIHPEVRVARFEKLEPGELFIYPYNGGTCYAIKTQQLPPDNEPSNLLILGPDFPHESKECFLLPWQSTTVVSFGKNFSVILPTKPNAWFQRIDTRKSVCLAISDEEIYVCTNGGLSPNRFLQWFVEIKTGKVITQPLSSITAYTNEWQIALPSLHGNPTSIIEYP